MVMRFGDNGGGAPPRRGSLAATVPNAAGPLGVSVPDQRLLGPVSYARTGGNSNITVNASTGALSATAGIGAGATQSCVVTVSAAAADGSTIPVDVSLTGQGQLQLGAFDFTSPANSGLFLFFMED